MILFLSGAMSGIENYNRTAFCCAEAALSSMGHTVLSPANHIPITDPEAIPHDGYMAICLAMIDQCEAIIQLPGWRASRGANIELQYAVRTGKRVIGYDEFMRRSK